MAPLRCALAVVVAAALFTAGVATRTRGVVPCRSCDEGVYVNVPWAPPTGSTHYGCLRPECQACDKGVYVTCSGLEPSCRACEGGTYVCPLHFPHAPPIPRNATETPPSSPLLKRYPRLATYSLRGWPSQSVTVNGTKP